MSILVSHICSSFGVGDFQAAASDGGGSVALDHHSIQLRVYLGYSNKSLPVPVRFAPQTNIPPPQSALVASANANIWCSFCFVCRKAWCVSCATGRDLLPDHMRKIKRGQINLAQAGKWPQIQKLIFSLSSGPKHTADLENTIFVRFGP